MNVSSSGLSFLGFGDGSNGANNGTNGTRVPVQRASSVTHGLSTIRPGGRRGSAETLPGPSGTSTESSDRGGTAGHRPRHGRSASSTSFFAPAPSSPPRDRRAGLIGSSNSESDGEGSIPVKTNSGKNLWLIVPRELDVAAANVRVAVQAAELPRTKATERRHDRAPPTQRDARGPERARGWPQRTSQGQVERKDEIELRRQHLRAHLSEQTQVRGGEVQGAEGRERPRGE